MSTAHRMRISPFLMAIMAGNGANSGSLSPIAPTGLIVAGLMEKIGLGGMQIEAWLYNMLAHAIVAFGGYLLLGGWKLLRAGRRHQDEQQARKLEREHWITAGMIVVLLAAVIVLKAHVGLAAFTCAVLLSLLRVASDGEAIRQMPWSTILMVCGVSVLISLMEKTDGMKLFADLLAATATPVTAVPVMGLIVGLISAYSSTSGVVLPAFLPTVPALAAKLGGGDIAALAMTMNIGGHLVDVSPLSTIGALCVASLPAEEEARKLFYQLLAWGLSMVVVGAILCTLMFNN
jgi:di/tricarboxylate transporter